MDKDWAYLNFWGKEKSGKKFWGPGARGQGPGARGQGPAKARQIGKSPEGGGG